MEVDNLSIEISANSADAEKNLNNLVNALTKLTNTYKKNSSATLGSNSELKKLNKTLNTTNRRMKSFASIAGSFYANFFPVIRLMKSLGRAIEDTSGYLETFNFFEVSLNKAGVDLRKTTSELNKLSGLELKVFEDGTGQIVNTGLKNLGLNVNEVTGYMARLLGVTNSIGLSSRISEAAAGAFSKLAGDISSLYNIDYSSAATNLQSGLIGQSRALYKYGIDITNATLQTYAYEAGINKAVSEMTQAEKMQLRMLAILKQSKVAWGDLANTINSPANAIRQFKNNISELSIVIGQLFIPLLSKVMPIVNGMTLALKSLMTTIAGFFGVRLKLNEYGEGFNNLGEDVLGLEDNLNSVGNAAKEAKKQLAGYDELNVVSKDNSVGTALGGVGGIDLTSQIETATDEYMKAWNDAYNQMENRAQAFAEKIQKILQPIQDMFLHLSLGQFDLAGEDIGEFVLNILNGVKVKLKELPWGDIGTAIGEILAGIPWGEIIWNVLTVIGTTVQGLMTSWVNSFIAAPLETSILTGLGLLKFTGVGKLLLDALGRVFNIELGEGQGFGAILFTLFGRGIKIAFAKLGVLIPVLLKGFLALLSTGLGTALVLAITGALLLATHWDEAMEGLKNIFNGFMENTIKPLKEDLSRIVKEIITDFSNFSKTFENIFTVIGGIIDGFKKILGGLITFLAGAFTGDWKKAWNGLKDIFKGIMNAVISVVEGMINGIINGINFLVSKLNGVVNKIGDVIGIDINISQIPRYSIPRLATGGIVDMPTVAMIGERGAEAVMPLERNTGWIDSLADKIAVKMADTYVGGDTNVVIEGDVAKFFKAVKKENQNYRKQTGRFAY